MADLPSVQKRPGTGLTRRERLRKLILGAAFGAAVVVGGSQLGPSTAEAVQPGLKADSEAVLLVPSSEAVQLAPYHQSHRSHYSHQSHRSHYSHYSSRY